MALHEFQEIGDSGWHFKEELIIVTEFCCRPEEETTGRKYGLVQFCFIQEFLSVFRIGKDLYYDEMKSWWIYLCFLFWDVLPMCFCFCKYM